MVEVSFSIKFTPVYLVDGGGRDRHCHLLLLLIAPVEKQEMKQAAFQPGFFHYFTFSPSQTQSPPPQNISALKYDREHKVCIYNDGRGGWSQLLQLQNKR